jgi:hypothetical protein
MRKKKQVEKNSLRSQGDRMLTLQELVARTTEQFLLRKVSSLKGARVRSHLRRSNEIGASNTIRLSLVSGLANNMKLSVNLTAN